MEFDNRFVRNLPHIVHFLSRPRRKDIWAQEHTLTNVDCVSIAVILTRSIAIGSIKAPVGSSSVIKCVVDLILRECHQQISKLLSIANLPLLVGHSMGTMGSKSDVCRSRPTQERAVSLLFVIVVTFFLNCCCLNINGNSRVFVGSHTFSLTPVLQQFVTFYSKGGVAIRCRHSHGRLERLFGFFHRSLFPKCVFGIPS